VAQVKKSIRRRQSLLASKFTKEEFVKDEEKPEASKKSKRRSLLTRLLSLLGGRSSNPGHE